MSCTGHLQYLDEHLVLYPCGHSTVVYNTETRVQSFINGSLQAAGAGQEGQPVEGITALAVTPNRRVIGIAERGAVGLYDVQTLRRRRVLNSVDPGSQEIRSVAFSSDSKTVLTLGSAPDWTLVVWTTDRTAKITATMKLGTTPSGVRNTPLTLSDHRPSLSPKCSLALLPGSLGAHGSSPVPSVLPLCLQGAAIRVRQADISPFDASMVCVTGSGCLRLLKVAEGSFKPVPLGFKREPVNYTAHCWLPNDQLVVCTDQGEILLLENSEFRATLQSANGEAVYALKPYTKGFVCGGALGALRIFERSDDEREFYRCVKTYKVEGDDTAIMSISVSPSEDNLVCSTAKHQAYTFALGSTDILRSGDASFRYFELLTGSEAHGPARDQRNAAIVAMDVCIWKPLLATCGRDNTVRLWNFDERCVELTKCFDDEPLSLSLHPSGLFVVVGFTDKVRLMSLLINDMRVVLEVPVKGCREVVFSHGGHFFAVTNQSAVQVYGTYTCALHMQLRGHQQSVRRIMWADRDRKLVTVGKDGNAFLWDMKSGTRLEESMQPRTTFSTATLAGDAAGPASRLFAVATDNTIRSFVAATIAPENQVLSDVEVSCLAAAANGRALFIGTAAPGQPGTVVAIPMKDARFPGKSASQIARAEAAAAGAEGGAAEKPPAAEKGVFPPPQPMGDSCEVLAAHSSATRCLALSTDGRLLFSGGDDGSLCMFEVREVDGRGVVKLQQAKDPDAKREYASEVLVMRSELVAKKRAGDALALRVDELKLSNEHQLRQKDLVYKERVAGVTEKFSIELEACRRKYAALLDDKDAAEARYEDRLDAMRAGNAAELAQRKEQYRVKIATERSRKESLQAERKMQAAEYEATSAKIVAAQKQEVEEHTVSFEARLVSEQAVQAKLHESKEALVHGWEASRRRLEDDSDLEVDTIKAKYERRLRAELETTTRLKGEHASMKKRYQVLLKEVKEQEEAVKGHRALEKQLHEVQRGVEKDILGHKKEIREREETIAEKDKRILELKKKNTELEKFKFVLDYKIKELKRQIEPRENEIADMRTQVEEMDMELEQYHKSNSALDLMIGELKQKIDGVQREMDGQDEALKGSKATLAKFRRDLEAAAQDLGNYKKVKHSVRALFAKYVQAATGRSEEEGSAADPQMDYNREREHLERNVTALKKKIGKDMELFMGDHARLTREGVNLTEEMNLLRREAKLLKRQQRSMDLEASGIGAAPASSAEARRELEIQEAQLVALETRARELKLLLGIS